MSGLSERGLERKERVMSQERIAELEVIYTCSYLKL